VVVISGTRIIGSNVLTAIGTVVINMHAGITPRYRGTHGAYWALAEGHPEHAGVTVHVVDRGIDTGGIVAQTIVHPTGEDSFVTLPYLQLEAGLPLLVEATAAALRGQLATIPSLDPAESKLWFHPTLREYFSNWLRRGVR
jgi:methionyl-tRNA formyltransferase